MGAGVLGVLFVVVRSLLGADLCCCDEMCVVAAGPEPDAIHTECGLT